MGETHRYLQEASICNSHLFAHQQRILGRKAEMLVITVIHIEVTAVE